MKLLQDLLEIHMKPKSSWFTPDRRPATERGVHRGVRVIQSYHE